MHWTRVGTDSFYVDIYLYADCNGVAPYYLIGLPAKCSTTGQTINTTNLQVTPVSVDVTPVCPGTCTRCQSSSCSFPYGIRKHTYTGLLVLSTAGTCCQVTLSWTDTSRPSSITTGAAYANFYTECTLNRCASPADNAPVASDYPFRIACVGQDLYMNLGVTDFDVDSSGKRDSLVYEWAPPLSAQGFPISYTGQYTYDKPIYFWGFPNA
jgi:hypothetical protein